MGMQSKSFIVKVTALGDDEFSEIMLVRPASTFKHIVELRADFYDDWQNACSVENEQRKDSFDVNNVFGTMVEKGWVMESQEVTEVTY